MKSFLYSLSYRRRVLFTWRLYRFPRDWERYVEIVFEPRDVWTGIFWQWEDCFLDIFVCLVPCVVIHVAYNVSAPALRETEQ